MRPNQVNRRQTGCPYPVFSLFLMKAVSKQYLLVSHKRKRKTTQDVSPPAKPVRLKALRNQYLLESKDDSPPAKPLQRNRKVCETANERILAGSMGLSWRRSVTKNFWTSLHHLNQTETPYLNVQGMQYGGTIIKALERRLGKICNVDAETGNIPRDVSAP
jgi:hypothetical protein